MKRAMAFAPPMPWWPSRIADSSSSWKAKNRTAGRHNQVNATILPPCVRCAGWGPGTTAAYARPGPLIGLWRRQRRNLFCYFACCGGSAIRNSARFARCSYSAAATSEAAACKVQYVVACWGSPGRGLHAGGDQRTVRRVADATRCGPLGREGGRVPGAAAIGDEQHLIVTALRGTARRIAVRANDPRRRRPSGGTRRAGWPRRSGLACRTRRPGWSRIALFAAHEANGQCDCDQGSIQMHGFPPTHGFVGCLRQ
jgi:hypothetical protein